jgi:hypothetical protein
VLHEIRPVADGPPIWTMWREPKGQQHVGIHGAGTIHHFSNGRNRVTSSWSYPYQER